MQVPERLGHYLENVGDGPVLYLCPLPYGPPTALTGSGAVIWLCAAEGEDDVPASVAGAFGVGVETIRDQVESFLEYLVASGFLDHVP